MSEKLPSRFVRRRGPLHRRELPGLVMPYAPVVPFVPARIAANAPGRVRCCHEIGEAARDAYQLLDGANDLQEGPTDVPLLLGAACFLHDLLSTRYAQERRATPDDLALLRLEAFHLSATLRRELLDTHQVLLILSCALAWALDACRREDAR